MGRLMRVEVVPVGRYGWLVYDQSEEFRTRYFDRKKDAIAFARGLSEGLTVRIHDQKGRFQEERTYPRARDPKRSKG